MLAGGRVGNTPTEANVINQMHSYACDPKVDCGRTWYRLWHPDEVISIRRAGFVETMHLLG